MSVLEVRNLKKSFGKDTVVLKGVDFSLEKGETVAIIGSSGSGKTTLLRCLNFLTVPDEGQIVVNDETLFDDADPNTQKEREIRRKRLHFGLVFQNFNLFPHFTVLQNVTDALISVQKRPKEEALARGRELLAKMGLADKEDMVPCELSGGQQQRVSIARALAGNPAVILADEPTGALDSHTGREVLGMLQDLHGQGHTVVLITHDNSIAVQADRIIRLEDGQVVYDGDSRAPEAIVQPTLNFEPAEQEGNK